jgi:hypothetical protein
MKQFPQPLTTAVITTKQVIRQNSTIVYIAHHEDDGAWVFTGAEEFLPENAMMISLAEMIKHDATILDVADMPVGFYAVRKDKNSPWKVVGPH